MSLSERCPAFIEIEYDPPQPTGFDHTPSGLPYTIIRPGRLIDDPYTSYDLNTLLKAKTDGKLAVVVGMGDTLVGETSRIDVATACVDCLSYPATVGKTFEIVNSGARPQITELVERATARYLERE